MKTDISTPHTHARRFTIGLKIGMGFGVVLLILALVGGLAVYEMHQTGADVHELSDEYVPELNIVGQFDGALAEARINGRSYQFTGDKQYLEKGRKAVEAMKASTKEAEALAARSTHLLKLKEMVKELPPVAGQLRESPH